MNRQTYVIFSILALVIGIATIMSLAYFADENMEATAIVPCFKADVPYVYVEPYHIVVGDDIIMPWNGIMIDGIFNFTISSSARELKGPVAQIEYYKIHIYSDRGSIITRIYCIAVEGKVSDPDSWSGYKSVITGMGGSGWCEFADGTVFDWGAIFGEGCGAAGISSDALPEFTAPPFTIAIGDCDGEDAIQIISDLRDAQKLYLEISKIGTVAYQLNSNLKPTIITLIEEEVLFQMEFTKIDSGFVYREFVDGSVGYPVRTPPLASLTMSSISLPFDVLDKLFVKGYRND